MGNTRKTSQKGPPAASSRKMSDAPTSSGKFTVEQVRHVVFPPVPIVSTSSFQATKLLLCLGAMAGQYLNIYRTVFWLPKPWTTYPVDIARIDPNLLTYIILMFVVPPTYEAFKCIYLKASSPCKIWMCRVIGIALLSIWSIAQFCALKHIKYGACVFPSWFACFFIVIQFPLVSFLVHYHDSLKRCFSMAVEEIRSIRLSDILHALQNGLKAIHQMLKCKRIDQLVRHFFASGKSGNFPRHSLLFPTRYATVTLRLPNPATLLKSGGVTVATLSSTNFSLAAFYTLRGPQKQALVMLKHNCARCSPSLNPESAAQATRDEADCLSVDFKARLVNTLVGTAVSTYLATILPLFFIGDDLNVDLAWCTFHALSTGLTMLLLHWQYHLPQAYGDLINKCARHLGAWRRVSASSTPSPAWSQLQTYPKGVNVRHIRGLFQSVGESNSAEPGNPSHAQLYKWYGSATLVNNLLYYAAIVGPFSQLGAFWWTYEWYKLLSMVGIHPFAGIILYRYARNRKAIRKVFEDKNPVYELPPIPSVKS